MSCAIGVVFTLLLALGVQSSVAGTYVMRSCDVPGHAPAPMAPWQATPTTNIVFMDSCATGGGYSFALPGVRNMLNPSQASVDLAPPADQGGAITVVGIRAWANTRLAGIGNYPLSARINVVSGSQRTRVVSFGDGASALEPLAATPLPQPAPMVQIALRCEGSDRPTRLGADSNDCVASDASPLELRGIEATLREDVAPTSSTSGGTLLTDQPVSGARSIDYAASDAESGLTRIEVALDDTVVATRSLGTRCVYTGFTPCPTADVDSFLVDTARVPDGRHQLTLRTFDAADNRHDEAIRVVDVRNIPASGPIGPPSGPDNHSPGSTPDGAGVWLTAGFAGSSSSNLVVPFGRRVAVRGRLSTAAGAGVANARIDVFERAARSGAKEVTAGDTTTRVDGTYLLTLSGTRPSRAVRLTYGTLASSSRLNVRVRAATTFTVSLRGTLVRFSGRVVSAPIPGAGKRVTLEGKAPGFDWAAFARVRTDRSGRFSGRYRLGIRRPGVKLKIRVRVPVEHGYPYLEYIGKPVTLTVR